MYHTRTVIVLDGVIFYRLNFVFEQTFMAIIFVWTMEKEWYNLTVGIQLSIFLAAIEGDIFFAYIDNPVFITNNSRLKDNFTSQHYIRVFHSNFAFSIDHSLRNKWQVALLCFICIQLHQVDSSDVWSIC